MENKNYKELLKKDHNLHSRCGWCSNKWKNIGHLER